MNAPHSPAPLARPVLLQTLWIFVTLNYLYADVIGLLDPLILRQVLRGAVDGLALTRPFLLAAAVMMEVPMAMVVASRVLPQRPNRAAQLFAGVFKTLAVAASLCVGTPSGYYLFFAAIEMACTSLIALLAWRWREGAKSPHTA